MANIPFPLVFAHRGAAARAPENSLAAFDMAVHQGADGIECDAQLTADGQAVILHDDTLDTTTTGRGPVKDLTLAQVQALRLRATRGGAATEGERVPTLAEVLARYGHGPHLLNVEIKPTKGTALAARVAELVVAARSEEYVLLSSFDVRALAFLADRYALLRRALLYPPSALTGVVVGLRGGLGWLTEASALGCEAIHPFVRLVNSAVVARAHLLGLNVNVWTVDEERTIRQMVALGVDGIITNDPVTTRAYLARYTTVRGGNTR